MGKLLFWLGIGAAQKAAGSKNIERRNWVVSLVVGVLVAAVMIVGMFLLLVSQKL
jgi:ATP/ADP translocase